MYKVSEILSCITDVAPLNWQESYDNSGLLIGDANALVDSVLLTLDVTEDVIDEAIEGSFRLIISHHPLIFGGLKNILTDTTTGKIITKAIKNDINIAAMHTNIDNSYQGVNMMLAKKLGLQNVRVLRPEDYSLSPDDLRQHGSGVIAELENEMSELEFLQFLKDKLSVGAVRHSALLNRNVKKIALCGGSGAFLINDAKRNKADVLVTADVKYHNFFDADNELLIVDAGHFETEQFTKQLFADIILKKNPKFAVKISSVKTNSVHYFV